MLRQLGLHNTFKTLPVDNQAGKGEVQARMIKAMSKGMTEAQVEVIKEHCTSYCLYEKSGENTRELDDNEIPWLLFQKDKTITFFFKPPEEGSKVTGDDGEVLQIVDQETLDAFAPVKLWGVSGDFTNRLNAGLRTVDDIIKVAKEKKDAEASLQKGFDKLSKKPQARFEQDNNIDVSQFGSGVLSV